MQVRLNNLGKLVFSLLLCCLFALQGKSQTTTELPDANAERTNVNNQNAKKITKDTIHVSKDSLDAPVIYTAKDSGVLLLTTKEFILYGKSEIKYKDVDLIANNITYNSNNQTVKAFGNIDTGNNPLHKPTLTQAGAKSISDSIFFNMKSLRGLTKNTFYNEGEMFVNATVLKKESKDVFYAWKGRFTTCNLDTPHFAIKTRKMKMINNKMAFSGPAFPEFENVPLPIGLPFGIFPLARGRHSGILAPQFVSSQDFGLGLEGLGFYKVINQNADLMIRTNIYSYGGWNINIIDKYIKRYKYAGSFTFNYQFTKRLDNASSTKDEFVTEPSYMFTWQHSRDNKSRPGTTFSASVNFASSRFNRNLLSNPYQNFQNQLNSTISYSKDWKGKANISINASHNQNTNNKLVNLSLPNINFNVVTFYPFQSKTKVGTNKWYENIGIGYSTNIMNQISFYDTAFSFKRVLDTVQWGATHNVPITLTLPALGPITLSPSVSYRENWMAQEIIRQWNDREEKVDTIINKGLFTARQVSFGLSANTRIFGTYMMKKSKNIVAIRHEMRPSFGISYSPNLNSHNYYSAKVDTTGRYTRFSKFDGVSPGGGAFSDGVFGGISFGIDNFLEMKVKDKTSKDSSNPTKKIKLIDGFGFNGSYNLLADSFALSTISMYVRSTLFDIFSINASATLDPYKKDNKGYRLKQYAWQNGGNSLGKIMNCFVSVSTQFKSKPRDGKPDKERMPKDPFMTPEEQQRQLMYVRNNQAEFTDFNIPWSINLGFSLNFNNQVKRDYSGWETVITSNVNFNGDFSLSPKWKAGATGYYDIKNLQLNQFSMFLSRELHCWQLSVNVNPIGIFRSFNVVISPKSGILRDLRINRSRTFSAY